MCLKYDDTVKIVAFNSLFEMRHVAGAPVGGAVSVLSILYLRCRGVRHPHRSLRRRAFQFSI